MSALSMASLAPTSDGGHLLAGDFDYEHHVAAWIMKVDPEGRFVWRRTFAAAPKIRGLAVLPLRDGGAYLMGSEHGSFWAARVAADGEVLWERTFVRGTPYAATVGRGERLVIAGITRQAGGRQTLLFVTPDGVASQLSLPGEDAEIWPRYHVPWFPAHRWRLTRDDRLIR